MNTQTFISTLVSNSGKELSFLLPDGTRLSGDLHITEIQNHKVDSVDCGGNAHQYEETVVQLWINESSEKVAAWTTDKAIKIFDIVGKKMNYTDAADLFIEFGDSNHPTIRYSIQEVKDTPGEITIKLSVKPTVCKPKLNKTEELASCC